VMLSALVADVVAQVFFGPGRFFTGLPENLVLHHTANYLLIAVLAVLAALIGLAFKNVLYRVEDLCDLAWRGRPPATDWLTGSPLSYDINTPT
jgi:chloride channel protein, CIC family